ncbi:phosphomannomutase [Saprolegnia parasitica CBS 223.65]|uniref:Phosphomannomutase n=1 Tax=Saprolegnia parasitica (strain CBS 223.65) TaxID=695850 RepID=A0A067CWQ7_SAPPC|nr:phosphomannomutase [Saprolegnia parasitica CBS 223.65]KDO34953.1 phosphomannomutase [Saprolegnia parasitica CBS 223.65]|eukprot:XP_012194607.1 phosphomannomutase [Saprolegnia parasitica CBS 223.65]
MAKANARILALFDVDGTLTAARKVVTPEVTARIAKLKSQITIGVVGGSDLVKQKEQLGENASDGSVRLQLLGYHNGKLINKTSLKEFLGNDKLNKFINFTLLYIANLDIPIKRGTFIEFRQGMLNVSPIGRNCSQEERDDFEQYDHIHQVRSKMVNVLRTQFPEYNLTYSIGGQISFDVFPVGWDKTYCLRFLSASDYDEIHFFGDKTHLGGNDYEIFVHDRTIGHAVKSPADTLRLLDELFPLK